MTLEEALAGTMNREGFDSFLSDDAQGYLLRSIMEALVAYLVEHEDEMTVNADNAWREYQTCNGPRDCVGTERGCVHCQGGYNATDAALRAALATVGLGSACGYTWGNGDGDPDYHETSCTLLQGHEGAHRA